MINFIRKSLIHVRYSAEISPIPYLRFLQSLKYTSGNVNPQSFKVSYLINSCGFSPETAQSISERVHFETPEKPDSVLAFYKSQGFPNSTISHIIQRCPRILLSKPNKTLLPKLEFFRAKGASNDDIVNIVSVDPKIFNRSIKKHIIPAYDFLKSFLKSDEKTIRSIKRYPGMIAGDTRKTMIHSIKMLLEAGVPESGIPAFLYNQPRMFLLKSDQFGEILEDVKKVGFDPRKSNFLLAVHVKRAMTKLTWKMKLDAYKRWGWSEKDTITAFRSHPWCMTLSEKKIMCVMKFFVKELGWESSHIAKYPLLLSLSLEKRIMPRASVLQFLVGKGMYKKESMSVKPYISTEQVFLEKFVQPHLVVAPQLMKIYREKKDSGIRVSKICGL